MLIIFTDMKCVISLEDTISYQFDMFQHCHLDGGSPNTTKSSRDSAVPKYKTTAGLMSSDLGREEENSDLLVARKLTDTTHEKRVKPVVEKMLNTNSLGYQYPQSRTRLAERGTSTSCNASQQDASRDNKLSGSSSGLEEGEDYVSNLLCCRAALTMDEPCSFMCNICILRSFFGPIN